MNWKRQTSTSIVSKEKGLHLEDNQFKKKKRESQIKLPRNDVTLPSSHSLLHSFYIWHGEIVYPSPMRRLERTVHV